MFDHERVPGKATQREHEPAVAMPGKRNLVPVADVEPARDEYCWEDITDEAFAAESQRASVGPDASAQLGSAGRDDQQEPAQKQDQQEDHEDRDDAAIDEEDLAALPPKPAPAKASEGKEPTNPNGERLKVADPFILVDGAIWYAYGTGLTVRKSKDQGATWANLGKMMSFGEGGRRWAPEVHKVGDQYVAYISISLTQTSRIKIYVATSDNPVKGWSTPRPIAASKDWNNIDATFFHDAKTNKNYLVWKEDRHASKGRKTIVMQELDASGTHLKTGKQKHTLLTAGVGAHSELERRPAPRAPNWSVEAPTLEFHGGKYWLFYSGAGFERGGGYFVGAASATKITGPFHREPKPLVRGTTNQAEPGHQSIIKVEVNGETRWLLFFHARGAEGKARYLKVDQLVWVDGHPHVKRL